MKTYFLMVVAAMATACSATSANAAVFVFSFSSSIGSGAGTFTTTTNKPKSNVITALSGTFNGNAMALIAPTKFPTNGYNENILYTAAPYLDFSGFSFSSGGTKYNIYFDEDARVYSMCAGKGTACDDMYDVQSFSVAPQQVAVPEPATWATMIVGMAFAGGILRRRTQQKYELRYNFT